jgi:hypothetical protein
MIVASSPEQCDSECTIADDPGGHILCVATCVTDNQLGTQVDMPGAPVQLGTAGSPTDCEAGCSAAGDPGGHILCVTQCLQNNQITNQVPLYTPFDAGADFLNGALHVLVPTWVWIGVGLVAGVWIYINFVA